MKKVLAAAVLLALTSGAGLACDTMESKVVPMSFCIDTTVWVADKGTPPQEYVFYDKDQTVGFTSITELGNANEADFRTAILNNAGGGSAQLLGERNETIAERTWHVLEYSASVGDLKLVYQNFYFVNPGVGGVQMVFFSGEPDVTKAAVRAGMILRITEVHELAAVPAA